MKVVREDNKEIFRITPDGRVVRDGVDITDDDAAVLQCMRDMIKVLQLFAN